MLKKEGKHTTAVQGSERTNFVEHEDDALVRPRRPDVPLDVLTPAHPSHSLTPLSLSHTSHLHVLTLSHTSHLHTPLTLSHLTPACPHTCTPFTRSAPSSPSPPSPYYHLPPLLSSLCAATQHGAQWLEGRTDGSATAQSARACRGRACSAAVHMATPDCGSPEHAAAERGLQCKGGAQRWSGQVECKGGAHRWAAGPRRQALLTTKGCDHNTPLHTS